MGDKGESGVGWETRGRVGYGQGWGRVGDKGESGVGAGVG